MKHSQNALIGRSYLNEALTGCSDWPELFRPLPGFHGN